MTGACCCGMWRRPYPMWENPLQWRGSTTATFSAWLLTSPTPKYILGVSCFSSSAFAATWRNASWHAWHYGSCARGRVVLATIFSEELFCLTAASVSVFLSYDEFWLAWNYELVTDWVYFLCNCVYIMIHVHPSVWPSSHHRSFDINYNTIIALYI